VKSVAELNQYLKLISPRARGETFGEKINDKIWGELNSTEEHRTRVIDWLDARFAHEIAKGFKGLAARLQGSKIYDKYRTFKNAEMQRSINKRKSPLAQLMSWRSLTTSDKCAPTERALFQAESGWPFYLHRKLPDEEVSETMKDLSYPKTIAEMLGGRRTN
jgi:hypothetical protein